MLTEQEINTVYDLLEEAQSNYSAAVMNDRDAGIALDASVARCTLAGLEGKNKEARDAELKELCADEYQEKYVMEQELQYTRNKLEIAKMRESRISKLLRLMEIQNDQLTRDLYIRTGFELPQLEEQQPE